MILQALLVGIQGKFPALARGANCFANSFRGPQPEGSYLELMVYLAPWSRR